MSNIQEIPEGPDTDHADEFRMPQETKQQALSFAGQLLMNYLEVIYGTGEDAEGEYKVAAEALRERAGEVVIEIARMEKSCHWSDYTTRWALIYAASELQHPAALPLFRSIVLTPIPPEESPDPHAYSTVEEETILRTTAVEGVAQLGRQGDKDAVETLFDFLSVASFSVKRAAVQGLLNVQQGESLRQRIEEKLCPEDRILLEIRPIDINKVTQIDNPEADLAENDGIDDKAVTPDLPDRQRKSRSSNRKSIDDAPSS